MGDLIVDFVPLSNDLRAVADDYFMTLGRRGRAALLLAAQHLDHLGLLLDDPPLSGRTPSGGYGASSDG